jgi:hypothetical protein
MMMAWEGREHKEKADESKLIKPALMLSVLEAVFLIDSQGIDVGK